MVFDMTTRPKAFPAFEGVLNGKSPQVAVRRQFELVSVTPKKVANARWPTIFDHRGDISVPRIASDIVKSIYAAKGYLHHLKTDKVARDNFETCMKRFTPHRQHFRPAEGLIFRTAQGRILARCGDGRHGVVRRKNEEADGGSTRNRRSR
jgi:hypothetical protein